MEKPRRAHSLFWPILLVGAGVILLLRNLGLLPSFSWQALMQLWPLLLVVLGLDILFGRRSPWFGTLVGVIAVAAVVAFLYFGASLGFSSKTFAEVEVFSTPMGDTTSAKYEFEVSSEPVNITALSNETELINAAITHNGTMNFDVTGAAEKTVRLSKSSSDTSWLVWDFTLLDDLKWDIGLNPLVPSEITLDGGSGSIDLDLANINLTLLDANLGSGSTDIALPASSAEYEVSILSGSGSVDVNVPEATTLMINLDCGSGRVVVNLPHGYALRLEVMDEGSGKLSLPDGLEKAEGTAASSEGAWQTAGFDTASDQITVTILHRGSGSIAIQ